MSQENGLLALKNKHRQVEKERKIKIDITKTQYPLIRNVAAHEIGWTLWSREDQRGDANLFWSDTYVSEELVKRLKPYQRINHFPNSQQLGKKNLLSENIKKMKSTFSKQYDFYPETWILPEQSQALSAHMKQQYEKEKKRKWLIVKPSASSQGKGIYLTKQIEHDCKQPKVVQEYIINPLLIDGCKFDLRIYVFIKSLTPLKIFRFEEGLARLSTAVYEKPSKQNKTNLNMHLTNYAINKWSPLFIQNKSIQQSSIGHKRSLGAIYSHLQKMGCNTKQLKTQIDQIIVKTVLSAYSKLLASYKQCRDVELQTESTCFEILGFDVLIDETFKPWLLQVNHSPSFCTDSPLDFVVKKFLILDTLILLNLNGEEKQLFLKNKPKEKEGNIKDKDAVRIKRKFEEAYQESHLGGFQKIYPTNNQSYSLILNKLAQRKNRLILIKKRQLQQEPLDVGQLQKFDVKNLLTESTKKRNALTLYGHFREFKKQVQEDNLESTRSESEEQSLRRHLFLERDKKKFIEPIKLNNVNISFYEDPKAYYKHGFFGKRSMETEKPNICKHNPSQSLIFEPKTSEGGRKEIKKLDHQIRSRIEKMKLARIKIHKIQSNQSKEKRLQSHSHRVMADPLRFQLKQLRGQNKYI